jgi:hypothetical protein
LSFGSSKEGVLSGPSPEVAAIKPERVAESHPNGADSVVPYQVLLQ